MPELISKNPTYNDFKLYYGLESTPGSQISLSDPHFSQIDRNGSYLTKNGVTLTEKDILDKWNNWTKIGPQGTVNYNNPILLDEVVIYPDKLQLLKLKQAFPDDIMRKSLLKYISVETPNNVSTYDSANRLLELYNLAGRPNIKFNIVERSMTPKVIGLHPDILINNTLGFKNGKRYPSYNIGKNILSEFGHSYSYEEDKNGNRFSDKIPWRFKDFRLPDFSIGKYENAYLTPGSEEFITHSIFGPAQYSFLVLRPASYFIENNKEYTENGKKVLDNDWYIKNKDLYNTTIKSIDLLKEFVNKTSNNSIKYGLSNYKK